jgi:hypothetical protein
MARAHKNRMSSQPPQDKHNTGLAGDHERGVFGDDLAVQQQVIEEYIREVEAEYEWQRRRLRLTRTLRQELHHLRKILEIRRVKMIVGSIAIVLAAAVLAGAAGRGPLAPLLRHPQHKPFVQRVLKQPPRPALLRHRAPALPLGRPGVPLGRCTNYMSEDGYRRWLRQTDAHPVCP